MSSRNSNLLTTILVVAIIGALLLAVTPSFSQLADPSNAPEVWVNAAWISNSSGDVVDADGHVFGTNAFDTIGNGVYNVQAGGIVHVAPATYTENVTITKPLTMLGNYADISGSSATRDISSESIIGLGYMPVATADGDPGIYIQSDGVVINGIAVVEGYGIMTPMYESYKNLVVKDVYMDNAYTGISLNATSSQILDSCLNNSGMLGIISGTYGSTGSAAESNVIDGNTINSEFAMVGIYNLGDYAVVRDNLVNSTNVFIGMYCLGDNGQVTGNTVNTTDLEIIGIAYGGNNGRISNNLINQSGWSGSGASGFALMGSDNQLTNNKVEAYALYNIFNCGSYDSFGMINNVIANNIVNSTYCEYAVEIGGDSNTLSNNVFNIPVEYSTAVQYYGNHANVAYNTFNFTGIDTLVPVSAQFSTSSASVPEQFQAFQMNVPKIADYSDSIIYVEGSYATVADNSVLNPTNYMVGSAGAASIDANYGIDVDGEFAVVDGNYLENVYYGIDVYGYKPTVTYNTVNNSEFYSNADYNINVYGDDSKIIGNTLTNNYYASEGIYLDESSGAIISDNVVTNAYYGIDIYGGDYGLGTNYVVENNTITTYEDDYDSYGIYAEYANDLLIKGNNVTAIDGISYEGIYTYTCSGVQMIDNYVENSEYCLDMEYGSGTNALIKNNTAVLTYDSSYAEGVYVYQIGDGLVIEDNKMLGNGASLWDYAIDVDGECGNVIIKNNEITNASYGIYFYGDETASYGSSIENNSIVNTLDQYADYGMYLEYAYSLTVSGNNITNEESYWGDGIYVWECGNLTISDNLIKNSDDGMDISAGCAPLYSLDVVGNTVINTIEMDSNDAIYVDYANGATIKDNAISSENGTWSNGIELYSGYSNLIDNNSIANANYGIEYYTEGSYSSKKTATVQAERELGPKSQQHPSAQLMQTSAIGTQPASDWCTIQNNYIDLTEAGEGSYGIQYYGQTGFIDYNTIIGSASTVAGIMGAVDNVSIIGNTVTGINQTGLAVPTVYIPDITSGALVLMSENMGSAAGNVYLAYNALTNNTVQMVIQDMTVFDLDDSNNVVTLNNSTLVRVISANTLDKAYWIVDSGDNLKMLDASYYLGGELSNSIVVFGDREMVDNNANVEAGDVVNEQLSCFTFDLPAGWSMISFPLALSDSQTESLPSELRANLTDMWWWDGSAWWYYSGTQGFSPYYTHLTNVVPGQGYWVKLSSPTKFTISGSAATIGVPTVGSGWTMVGVEGISSIDPASAYSDCLDMWYWDQGTWDYFSGTQGYSPYYAHITNMDPGKAYWVHY